MLSGFAAKHIGFIGVLARVLAGGDSGMADIADRRKEFTDSDDLKNGRNITFKNNSNSTFRHGRGKSIWLGLAVVKAVLVLQAVCIFAFS